MRHVLSALLLIVASGCASYALRVAPAPARDVPTTLDGARLGPLSKQQMNEAGWALAEDRPARQVWIVAAPQPGVRESEAIVELGTDGAGQVTIVRERFRSPRLATYRQLLDALIARHGAPQVSVELDSSSWLESDPRSDRPRPARVVEHRWQGPHSQLVLVAGLEAEEHLRSGMEYQLLLLPVDAP